MYKQRTAFQAYLASLGDKKAAEVLGITQRTAKSWRLGYRRPRPEKARDITARSGLQMEDMYA